MMKQTDSRQKKLAYFLGVIRSNPVIACLEPGQSLEVVKAAPVSAVIIQHGTLQTLPEMVQEIQLHNKFTLVEVDRLDGVKADASGLQFLDDNHVDGVITTRGNILGAVAATGLLSVLRCFLVDRKSRDKAVELSQNLKPDMLEILPAAVVEEVSQILEEKNLELPVIASGLLTRSTQVQDVLDAGAAAVSTSFPRLWQAGSG